MTAEIRYAHPIYMRADGLFAWNVYYQFYRARLGMTVPAAANEAEAISKAAEQLARYS